MKICCRVIIRVKESGKATVRRLIPAPRTRAEPAPSIIQVSMAAITNAGLEGIISSTPNRKVLSPRSTEPRRKVLTRPREGRRWLAKRDGEKM